MSLIPTNNFDKYMMLFRVFIFLYPLLCCLADYQDDLDEYLSVIEAQETCYSGIEGVDKIYVINLDRATDRWKHMQSQLETFNLKADRFSAINGWSFTKAKLKYFYNNCLYPSNQRFLKTPGMIGCFLSHLSILKDAYEQEYEVIWIMEDDVKFLKDPRGVLTKILKEFSGLNQTWDVLYTDTGSRFQREDGTLIYYTFEGSPAHNSQKGRFSIKEKKDIKSGLVDRIDRRLGMYSILISRRGIAKILEYFYENKMEYAYDVDVNFYKDKWFFQTKQDTVSTVGAFGSSTSVKGDEVD